MPWVLAGEEQIHVRRTCSVPLEPLLIFFIAVAGWSVIVAFLLYLAKREQRDRMKRPGPTRQRTDQSPSDRA